MRPSRRRVIWQIAAFLLAIGWANNGRSLDREAAAKLAGEYLATSKDSDRRRLVATMGEYDGEIHPVLDQLSARSYRPVKAGYHPAESFSRRELRRKHADDLLYFMVPNAYRPDRRTGLIVFLHGGGRTTSRRAPRVFMNIPDKGQRDTSNQLGDLFAATGMIAVGPSAPWNENSPYRWCLEECDDYLADVIGECRSRFNIDPDRVFLMGHSMGGFGAYHHIQRQPDRFAGVLVSSGSWSLGYWPVIRGTPLFIVQGASDARPGIRWHYTDVRYGRFTDKLLGQAKLDYRYWEHDGQHAVRFGREHIAKFLKLAADLRRDPYYPHVTLASPVGFKRSHRFAVEHNRWLTLNETAKGEIQYDELVSHDNGDFDSWRLEHRQSKRRGAAIDAVNRGDNTIVVTTQNVARFTVWLHPRMVDVTRPVMVVVNGKNRFTGNVKPSLETALESYARREDWGLVYPIKIEIAVAR